MQSSTTTSAPHQLPTAPSETETEVVLAGLSSYSQAGEFLKVIYGLLEIVRVEVREIQKSTLLLHIQHQPGIDLARLIGQSPNLPVQVIQHSPGHLRFEVFHRSTPTKRF